MINKKKELEIFNLSFLDIISCAFGAVVMLVLIIKPYDGDGHSDNEVKKLLQQLITLENNINDTNSSIKSKELEIKQLSLDMKKIENSMEKVKNNIQQEEEKKLSLNKDIEGLKLVTSTLKKASLPSKRKIKNKRDDEVGGIPVDSNYIIFVIDLSGSMKEIWDRVSSEIINILNIHPKVKGFQILSDMGVELISGYKGKWIPDTPSRRKNAIKVLYAWGDVSNSSPVEGIETALKRYAKPNLKTSIYVFGDDYTGSSYEPTIERITKLNTQRITAKKKLAKIHGIGFISEGTTDRFGKLMREIAKENDGAFLALPVK